MGAAWIFSANASCARFVSQAHFSDPLQGIDDMVNEAVCQRMVDMGETDKIDPTLGMLRTLA